MLLTRFWQRGAETSLALQNPIPSPSLPPILPVAAPVDPTDPLHPSRRIQLAPDPHAVPPTPRPNPLLHPSTNPIPESSTTNPNHPPKPQHLTAHSPRRYHPETHLR
jgi:hypothetical protein